MKRPVIAARLVGRTVTLRPVRDCTVDDIAGLVARAAVPDYRRTRGGVILGASRLPDVEAAAEHTRWYVVVRQGGAP